MTFVTTDQNTKCFHCGDECDSGSYSIDNRQFCCQGCQSVYEILSGCDLEAYYKLETHPGFRQIKDHQKFEYLDHAGVQAKLLDFSSDSLQKVRLSIPKIHCSSCIWLLENLRRLDDGVLSSTANFGQRALSVDYDPQQISLRALVELLASIGYEPLITLEQRSRKQFQKTNRRLILRIAVAGFCFGNIMLLSFPEYLGLDVRSEAQFTRWFSGLIMLLSLPVLGYCASEYFYSAYKSIRQKFLNIDVPIVVGILALAGWSYYEILANLGPGYLDSLAGLLFLLLIGKWFQSRTYTNLSFNRDFKSYFPLAVSKVVEGGELTVLVDELQVGDTIVLRNSELIPADSVLLTESSLIDYSFVSGESRKIQKSRGDLIYAGGRHQGQKSHYQVIKAVSQSYLTQLWNHQTFKESTINPGELLINQISKHFTVTVLLIALSATGFWLVADSSKAIFVFTSVLIVACPCALAMATPFTLGSVMKVLGNHKLYLKNAQVVDRMAGIKTMIFDKTGTLTRPSTEIIFSDDLRGDQAKWIYTLTGESNHPGSREIHAYLRKRYHLNGEKIPVYELQEHMGEGISAVVHNHRLKLGKASYVTNSDNPTDAGIVCSIDDHVLGSFIRKPSFREGLTTLFFRLASRFRLVMLSGDHQQNLQEISRLFPQIHCIRFRQTPKDKLDFISQLEEQAESTMMLGDGLNDAGALKRSSVGLAVTEEPHHFTPASDGILHASSITKLDSIMTLARWARIIMVVGFGFSFVYNLVGLSFAVTGMLTPLLAAILMPLSSLTVMIFVTCAVKLAAFRLQL